MFSSIFSNRSNTPNGPVLEVASEIPAHPVSWLWRFWLARGKLHILAGPPSTGKTTLALQVAATLTCGGTWPDGSQAPMGRVVIWTCEDGIEDTIMPRLIACGVDQSKVYILRVTKENNRTRAFDFTRDLAPLAAKVDELGDVALVIIDSIVQVVTGNSNNNSQVRKDLDPLVKFAEQTNCAILGLTHVNKGSKKKDPLERVNGSTAIGALARLVWIVARDVTNHAGNGVPSSVLVRAKSNLGPTEGGFAYHVQGVDVPIDTFNTTHSSRVVWDYQLQGSPKEILDEAEGGGGGGGAPAREDRKQEAMAFLLTLLAIGPVPTEKVEEGAKLAGLSWATVRRASEDLKVKKYRAIGDSKWYWSLPASPARSEPHQPGQAGSPGSSGAFSAGFRTFQTDHVPSVFAASAGAGSGWAKPSQPSGAAWGAMAPPEQSVVAAMALNHENGEQVEQVEQVTEHVGGIDVGTWHFMVDQCLKKYRTTSPPYDADEHAELRESIVDSMLDVKVDTEDDAWKARAKAALLSADFWFT